MNVKGTKELIQKLKQIPKELDRDIDAILEKNAADIQDDAQKKAPVGTPTSTGIKGYLGGTLQQSILAQKVAKKTWTISTKLNYAIFVEIGTRFMRAQPFLIPAFFKGRSKFVDDLENLIKKKVK